MCKGPRCRAEATESSASLLPTTTQLPPTSTAMEDGDAMHDAFSSAGLWEESKLFAQADTHESALFAPLQLDSE